MEKASQYAEYVDGKTIAAVGRARPFKDQSGEIGRHNLVMVTSFDGKFVPEYYSRCNISVFNRGHARNMVHNPEASSRLALDWVLLRTAKFRPSGRFVSRLAGGVPYFGGLGNQIPIFLNDIVRFKPDRVTVYGTDLYLSGYDESRPGAGQQPDREAWRQTVWEHDQPRVRRYYQLMFELYGFLVPDSRLDTIIGMSDRAFLSALEEAWK
jgi:hypothetical protein